MKELRILVTIISVIAIGYAMSLDYQTCERCGGNGYRSHLWYPYQLPCPTCKGKGKVMRFLSIPTTESGKRSFIKGMGIFLVVIWSIELGASKNEK